MHVVDHSRRMLFQFFLVHLLSSLLCPINICDTKCGGVLHSAENFFFLFLIGMKAMCESPVEGKWASLKGTSIIFTMIWR